MTQDGEVSVARYSLVWLEIAREDYASLAVAIQRQFSARVEQLLENPRHTGDDYDELTDQWTTTYGGGAGLSCTPSCTNANA